MTYEIRTLAKDEKITEPGFYQISLDRHHDQPCDGPSVTSGILRKMELHTPADVWFDHKLNPHAWPKEPPTAALRLGSAMAYYVEGHATGGSKPDVDYGRIEVKKHFNVHKADKPRKPTEAQIAAYDRGEGTEAGIKSVEYWRDVEARPSDWMTEDELDLICTMGRVLAANPLAANVMEGIPECTMAWRDEETGLWLLARPDTVSFDGTQSDYKKMSASGKPFNARLVDHRITDHAYDQQMAFGAEVFEKLTGEWPSASGIVAQSDKPPHHVILRGFDEEDMRLAQFRNRRQIQRFAECLESGHWPGPGEHVGNYHRPDRQREKLLEDMNTEGKSL